MVAGGRRKSRGLGRGTAASSWYLAITAVQLANNYLPLLFNSG
jgi:hypothetical protein